MHQARAHFGITFDEKRKEVYVLGGFIRYSLNHCEKFNTLTGKWIVIAPMNNNNRNVSACVLNSQFVFAIGGWKDCDKNEIEKYSIALNSWESIQIASDLKLTLRAGCLSFSINSSSILIAGGHGKDHY